MGCNCKPSIRKDKDHIIRLAEKFALMEEIDVEVFYEHVKNDTDLHYDFQKKGSKDRGAATVKIIEFRKLKSKNVLSNPERVEGTKKTSGGANGTTGRKGTGGSGKNKQKVGGNTKSPGGSKPSGTGGKMEADS